MNEEHVEPWVGVDLDATLAFYEGWIPNHIGAPIPAMVDRVKEWLKQGKKVKIMTARMAHDEDGQEAKRIGDWTELHCGQRLEATCSKDYGMIEQWDDRAVRVMANTGMVSDGNDVEDPLMTYEPGDIGDFA